VASPLSELTKNDVRGASRELGLPNWNHAASPCLRSRLAFSVEVRELLIRSQHVYCIMTHAWHASFTCQATAQHLAAVESAENLTRKLLSLTAEDNLRVRMVRCEHLTESR
jgi:uncharacterized protein